MNEQYSLKLYLPLLQSAFVYGIHYLYLLGLYILFYAWFEDIMPVFFGVFFLTGLYVLCIVKQKYLLKLPQIISGFLIFMTADTLFCFFFSGIGGAVWFCSYTVLISFVVMDVRSWKNRIYRHIYSLQWYYIAEPVLMYIYGAYKHENGYRIFALFLMIFWLLTHFVGGYLKEIEHYFDINRNVEGTPRSTIFQKSSRLLCGIVGVMFFALLVSVFFRFDEAFVFFGMLALRAIAGLVLLISYLMLFLERLHLLPSGLSGRLGNMDLLSMIANSRWFLLWEILSNLLFFFIIGCLIRNALRYFEKRAKQEESEKKQYVLKAARDIVEDIKPVRKKRAFRLRNNRERVRYLFYKQVKKQYGNEVPAGRTAQELLGPASKEKKLAALYDVARYSEHDIANEEIRKCRPDSL